MSAWLEPSAWRSLEPMLDEALDSSPEARVALIEQLRSRDPDLAAQLEELLRHMTGSESQLLLDRSAGEVFTSLLGDDTEVVAKAFAEALPDRYTIIRQVGSGGMAAVYLAHDRRHDREVAVKVLHPALSAALGSQRFLEEIRTTARLQHPHLLPLLDSGEAGGQLFYAMPYVRGESLRALLMRERMLPLDDALRMAREIAGALDYAHRNGVIHRDIKPENILLHEGQAIVADWGIALAASVASESDEGASGARIGTPRYMSPEQARGEARLDARCDIYALGCVLYEMIVGRPPFSGASATEIAAKAMRTAPLPPSETRDTVPPRVDAIILKAIARLPADRYQSAAQFAHAIGNAETATDMPQPQRRAGRVRTVAIGAVSMALVIAGVFAAQSAIRDDASRVSRMLMALPAGQGIASAIAPRFAFSRDGNALAYVGSGATGRQLWVKRRDQLSGLSLPGTDGAEQPAFSPDGRQVAFMVRGPNEVHVRVISVDGGPATTLATSTGIGPSERSSEGFRGMGVAWGLDGYIYMDGEGGYGARRVRASGGPVEHEAVRDSLHELAWWPQPLDDGQLLVTLASFNATAARFRIALTRPGRPGYRVITDGTFARLDGRGNLVFVTASGDLMGAPLDLRRGRLRGPPVKLAEGIDLTERGGADVALSATGTLAYVPGVGGQGATPVWVTRDGRETEVDSLDRKWRPLAGFGVSLSPNGKQVAYTPLTDSGRQIWIRQLPSGPLQRLTLDGPGSRPSWEDQRTVLFTSRRAGGPRLDVWAQPADGSAPATLRANIGKSIEEFTRVAGTGVMVLRVNAEGGGSDLMTLAPGDTRPRPLVVTPFQERVPVLSPDGRFLAYVSNESGRQEVYVRPFPAIERGKVQVSDGGGTAPLWSRDGREIFYLSRDRMVAARIGGASPFSVTRRQELFPATDYLFSVSRAYDVAPDGRFLMFRRTSPSVPSLAVIEHFAALLTTR